MKAWIADLLFLVGHAGPLVAHGSGQNAVGHFFHES